jgi:hypothetical protein
MRRHAMRCECECETATATATATDGPSVSVSVSPLGVPVSSCHADILGRQAAEHSLRWVRGSEVDTE